eukprot:1149422-Pelagomonas_calceolata.AAC.3
MGGSSPRCTARSSTFCSLMRVSRGGGEASKEGLVKGMQGEVGNVHVICTVCDEGQKQCVT